MSIILLFVIIILVCLGAWIVSQSNFPDPAKWACWGILFIIVLFILLKVSGISLGSI